jgi:glycosyltransferase involved in cell wall biosynthesis
LKVIPNDEFFALVEHSIATGERVTIRVRGSSMHPTLRDNLHHVVLEPYTGQKLRVGTVALIRYGGRHVLHRLVARRGAEFVFRGDNLPHTVERVNEGDVVALVRRIIDPRGRETDCSGVRFAVTSRCRVMTARPRSMFLAHVAALRAKLEKRKGDDRIKVLFFIESLAGGGAEKILSVIANHIDKSRFDVTVATVLANGVHVDAVRRAVRLRPMIRARKGLVYSILYHLIYFILSPKWIHRIFLPRGSDVEIAFCEGFSTRIIAAGNRRKRKIAWVHTDLEANPWTDVVFRSTREQAECYRLFDTVACVSEGVKEAFERRFGVAARTIYNPVDSNAIRHASSLPKSSEPRFRPLFVTTGRLVEQKGYDRLLAIAARLRDEGMEFELWILGDGAGRGALEEYIARHNLSDRVTLWGFVDNPYPWIAAGDVFVCSSRSEGYSTAATEAIILGVPVVTTLCAGMRELLGDNGEGGGWIAPNDDNSLYEPLKKIATDPACLDPLRRAARRRGNDFSISTTMGTIEKLLSDG